MWIIFLVLLITFEAFADIFAKEWSLHGKIPIWCLAITGYILANIFWLFAIRSGSGLARGAVLFSVCSAIAAIVIGLLVYKEQVTKMELAGIIVGVVAIALIYWPHTT